VPPGTVVPQEWDDFMLMKEMGWSWRDLTGQFRAPILSSTMVGVALLILLAVPIALRIGSVTSALASTRR